MMCLVKNCKRTILNMFTTIGPMFVYKYYFTYNSYRTFTKSVQKRFEKDLTIYRAETHIIVFICKHWLET